MAHECPDCGQGCYCDGDDTWMDLVATGGECDCPCAEEDLLNEPDDITAEGL